MTTQQANQKAIRRVIHKHLWVGNWLICINTERGYFDAVFLGRDNRLVVYPTSYVKERIDDELLSRAHVEAIGHILHFEIPDETRFVGLLSVYEKDLQPQRARWLRRQLGRVSSTKECHEFVNDLMCLEFGVCQGDGE
jgi:hypothetical protein